MKRFNQRIVEAATIAITGHIHIRMGTVLAAVWL